MSAQDPDEEALFQAARRISDASVRAQFLSQACADNSALADRVRALLKMHEEESESLQGPADHTVDYEPGPEAPDSRVGRYRLMEQIGEGGFGLVFVAEQQEPVRRRVALKILKPGMDSKQIIARFEAERQALALMDHPNIARVFDAGATESGRPYFVMELVPGVRITDYCDQHRLALRERLELFITVCQAIQHAHQKGIIHRDIKPSNVLVTAHDDKPVPKVIDFGVAKAISQHLSEWAIYTNLGQMIGTPLYMSPEQAGTGELDIDTRSDIYSLGVLLYELLTGSTPLDKRRFARADYDEIRQLIREEEPRKPSGRVSSSDAIASIAAERRTEPAKLSKLIHGDLDWITMKALEKDRTRRYETANGLARDIQRYLADEGVEARPASTGYRLRKFAKKHQAALTTAVAIVVILLTGIAATSLQAVRARRAERAALAARDEAEQARRVAETREAETAAVLAFVENKIFAAARPKDRPGGQGYDVKLADAVKAGLPFVGKSFSGQPLIEARLRMTMGSSFWYLGDAKTAIDQLQAAHKLYTAHRGPEHPDTLMCRSQLANAYYTAGRTREALKLREETLQLMKAKLGPDHPVTLADMNNLANSYHDAGQTQKALKLREEMLLLQKAKLGPDHSVTLANMNNLSISYESCGRTQEALKLREETLQLMKAKLGPDHPDTLMCMHNLASSYHDAGRTQEALKLREETLQLMKAKLGPHHPDTLLNTINLANSYHDAGRTQEALKLCEEMLPLMKAKLGLHHPGTLLSMNSLARFYIAVGEATKAIAILQETLGLREQGVKAEPGNGPTQSFLAWTHGQMGEAEQSRLDYAAAVQAYASAVEMFEKLDRAGALKDPTFRVMLNFYRQQLAQSRKAEQAVKDIDFAIKQPEEEVGGLLIVRVRFLLKARKLAAAVESAAKLKERADDKAEQLYDAACAYALCAGAKSAADEAPRLVKPCADEAMTLLKQAVAKGYKDVAHMKLDRDLDALGQRADFQKLLAGLEAAKKE